MKSKFLNYSLNTIKKYNSNIDDIRLDELRFGLEGFYITITKSIMISFLSIVFNIFYEMLLMLLFFNILRITGFGLHASKSSTCLFSSSLIFIIFPILSKLLIIPTFVKIFLGILAIILIFLYTPADTKKRPIIYKQKRDIYRFTTTINAIILVFIAIFVHNEILSNLIIFGIYCEVIMILPITYKMFNLPYNNYKNYIVNRV